MIYSWIAGGVVNLFNPKSVRGLEKESRPIRNGLIGLGMRADIEAANLAAGRRWAAAGRRSDRVIQLPVCTCAQTHDPSRVCTAVAQREYLRSGIADVGALDTLKRLGRKGRRGHRARAAPRQRNRETQNNKR